MNKPNILVLDIETAPILAQVWGIWQQNVGINQIDRDWYMLTWAAKWLDEDNVVGAGLNDYPQYKNNPECDAALLADLGELLDLADVVVGHNSKRFDIPKIRARMAAHGMPPFSPVLQVDTLTMAKGEFAFTSNKLDFVARALGVGRKLQTGGHELWANVLRGDPTAWATMLEYNKQDVLLTEQVYLKLRPWSRSHPNFNVISGEDRGGCPACGSPNLQRRGYAFTTLGRFQRFQCTDCGKWSRARQNMADLSDLKTNIM